MTIQQHLDELLKQNTGVHMLDSGGSNGRAWQRNQGKNFDQEPKVTINDWGITISIYHYLSDLLEVDELCEQLNDRIKDTDIHWTGEMLDQMDLVEDLFIEDYKINPEVNTYNYDSFLSQVLQYFVVGVDDDAAYIFLQIHGGADVRGGYTAGRWFKLCGYLESCPRIYASIDGIECDTFYDGYNLRASDTQENEENGYEVDSEIELHDNMVVDYAEYSEIDEYSLYVYYM